MRDVGQWVWPDMGWRRFGRLQLFRLSRTKGGVSFVSRGFACGAAVSFTPFIGFHFILAVLMAKAIGGSGTAALIGTAVGNPWTFPFIWSGVYAIGHEIVSVNRDFSVGELSLSSLLDNPLDLFLPMLVGCIPLAVASWMIFYLLCKRGLEEVQTLRRTPKVRTDADL